MKITMVFDNIPLLIGLFHYYFLSSKHTLVLLLISYIVLIEFTFCGLSCVYLLIGLSSSRAVL